MISLAHGYAHSLPVRCLSVLHLLFVNLSLRSAPHKYARQENIRRPEGVHCTYPALHIAVYSRARNLALSVPPARAWRHFSARFRQCWPFLELRKWRNAAQSFSPQTLAALVVRLCGSTLSLPFGPFGNAALETLERVKEKALSIPQFNPRSNSSRSSRSQCTVRAGTVAASVSRGRPPAHRHSQDVPLRILGYGHCCWCLCCFVRLLAVAVGRCCR